MTVFFLPGRPPVFLIMMVLSLGISVLQRAMDRNKRFIPAPQITLPLACLALVVIATAKLTGGIGLHALGSSVMGGKKYIFLLMGILGYFALTARRIPPHQAGLYMAMFLLGTCLSIVGDLVSFIPRPFYFIFLIFPPDLSTLAGIMQAAAAFKQRHTHLHVLVNNAGAIFARRQVTSDGYEMTFALNHLNYFLLTNLLLDVLKASAPARIVCVSSHAHDGATINFDNLQGEKHFSAMQAYGESKLANVLFTYELARRLEGTGVTANALHPGFIATGFARNNGAFYNFGMKVIGLFIRKPEQGAQTSIYLACSPEV